MRVGFIGVGLMGHGMAKCLLENGHALNIPPPKGEGGCERCEQTGGAVAIRRNPHSLRIADAPHRRSYT